MKIARLRIKVITQNQKCFENYVIVVYQKTFENIAEITLGSKMTPFPSNEGKLEIFANIIINPQI